MEDRPATIDIQLYWKSIWKQCAHDNRDLQWIRKEMEIKKEIQ